MVEAAAPQLPEQQIDPGESMVIEDPAVYAQQENKLEMGLDQAAAEFTVRDPQDFNGHIVYVCKGVDL